MAKSYNTIISSAIRNITFMAPRNRDALSVSLFIGIGMSRRIGIHRNRDAPMNKNALPRNRDAPAHCYS